MRIVQWKSDIVTFLILMLETWLKLIFPVAQCTFNLSQYNENFSLWLFLKDAAINKWKTRISVPKGCFLSTLIGPKLRF